MAKKKSKTQKYKKNQKRKQQLKKNVVPKAKNPKQESPKTEQKKQLVPKEKVKYNVVLTETNIKKVQNTKNNSQKNISQLEQKEKPKSTKNSFITIIKDRINKLKTKTKQKKSENKKINIKIKKELSKVIPKQPSSKEIKKKNIIFRLFYELKKNLHIIFNTIIIVTFIILLIGLIRINVFKTGTIVYICCITLFLMLVAISYNKYLSGKIFTLIITAGMCLGIYYMQYTYDFIRNLNSNVYEYKTYYVVAFDTTINRSIYTINNKKVGLLKENCINIERKLNTKLDKVNYIEYDDINLLFSDFYNSKFKAILVNENQYNYLKNNIEEKSRDVKILYEFKANAKK